MAEKVESFEKAKAQETMIKAMADYTEIVFNYHRLPTPENHSKMVRGKFIIDEMLQELQQVAKNISATKRGQK